MNPSVHSRKQTTRKQTIPLKKRYTLGLYIDHFLPLSQGDFEVQRKMFLGIRNQTIVKIQKYRSGMEDQCDSFLYLDHHLVLPGLINAHTHLPMSLFRGLRDDASLFTWLYETIFPLEAHFVNHDFVRIGTQLSAFECIRFGTTTTNDMYYFPMESALVWEEVGLRGIFSQMFADFKLPDDDYLGKNREERFLYYKTSSSHCDRIHWALAPHAAYSCEDSLLKNISELQKAQACRINIHLSETNKEEIDSEKKYKESVTHRLNRLGILTPHTICHHSIHLSNEDLSLIQKNHCSLIHNPDSNMKLGSGLAPIPYWIKSNIKAGLGTDGAASNNNLSLFGAMNLATKIQKGVGAEMSAKEALLLATLKGAKALSLNNEIGSLEVNKKADLIALDLQLPHLQPLHDVISQLVYSALGSEVDTVICDGKLLMKDKKIIQRGEKKILSEAARLASKMREYILSTKDDISKNEAPLKKRVQR